MKINLIKGGIFPITKDENNCSIATNYLDTELDIAGTIQGEGIYMGVPSLFLRTSGCNLRCLFTSKNKKHNFCDTFYSSFKPEINALETSTIEAIIRNNIGNIKHLVITGGEPLLQANALVELLEKIKDLELIITIETNGTIYSEELAPYVHLFSISPKLFNSIPTEEKLKDINYYLTDILIKQHEEERYDRLILRKYFSLALQNNAPEIQFKFVVTSKEDIKEIVNNYLELAGDLKEIWRERFLLMPEGITEEELKEKSKWLIGECIKNNFRFCPRLHIDIYGGLLRYI